MTAYQEYLERCKAFQNVTVERSEINYTQKGYYQYSQVTGKYEYSTSNYNTASMLSADGITHIFVSETEIRLSL